MNKIKIVSSILFLSMSIILFIVGCSSHKPLKAPTVYKFLNNKIVYDHGFYRDFTVKDSLKIFSEFKEWYGTYSDPHWSWKSYMPLKARTAPKGGSYNTLKLINSNIKAQ